MNKDYLNDPLYQELLSVAAGGGSTEPLSEYLNAQGITQPEYNYQNQINNAPSVNYDDNLNNFINSMTKIYRENLGDAHGYPEGSDMYHEFMDPDYKSFWYDPDELDEYFGYDSEDPMDFYDQEALSNGLYEQGYYDNIDAQDLINWFRKSRMQK